MPTRPRRLTSLILGLATIGLSSLAQAEIVVGIGAPITGPYASFGEQLKRGAQAAVRDINAEGGINGEKLRLVIGDDSCDPKQAVAVANRMIGDDVIFVAGHFCSGSSIPASNVYAEEEILMISPGSTNPKLTERQLNNVFRTCGRDDQQGLVAANYIAEHLADKNIAIVHDKQSYSKGLADQTRANLHKQGIQEVLYEAITPGEKDYAALVSKLKRAKVDVLYYGGYHTEAGLIVRQMREQGLKTLLVSGDALVTEEFWGITGEAGEGSLMTFSPDPRRLPANKDLVARFRAENYEPEAYTLYTYATFQVFKQAVEATHSTDPVKLADYLHSGARFNTAIGQLSFDKKGDVTAPGYVFYRWSHGAYDYVDAP